MVPFDETSQPDSASGAPRPAASRLAFLLVVVGLAAVVGFVAWQGAARYQAATAAGKRGVVTIAVDGMSCVGCAGAVAASVEDVPGVAEVTVDYESRLARIRLSDEHVEPSTLVAAIERAGYKAHLETAAR